jgi:hypothetical protein
MGDIIERRANLLECRFDYPTKDCIHLLRWRVALGAGSGYKNVVADPHSTR